MGRGGDGNDAGLESADPSTVLAPSRIPGYRGFIPGGQHVFGKGQGAASGAGSLKNIAAANSDQKFLHFGENRCIAKSNLTLPEGKTSSLWAQGGHIPGYDGYIPGHDEEFDKTFGSSTVAAKLKQSKQQSILASADSIPQSEIHSSRGGATGDLGGRAKLSVPSPPTAPAPAVPGYRGYVSGRQHHYGRSFGSTLSDFEKLKGVENKGEQLKETDPRPAEHADITTSPRLAHIPGYAGYLPGLDSGIGNSFGSRTHKDMLTEASKIHATSGETKFIAIDAIHKAMGSPRVSARPEPPRAAPLGSEEQKTEPHVPGCALAVAPAPVMIAFAGRAVLGAAIKQFQGLARQSVLVDYVDTACFHADTGCHAGSQHLFGESQGKITQELRTAHTKNPADCSSKYVTFGEPRVFDRDTLTTKPSTENPLTGINDCGHLIGYTGHCPAMREAIGQRFGVATKDALYEKSQNEKWFAAHPAVAQPTTAQVSRHNLPKQLGSTRDTTVNSHRANDFDSNGRSVFTGSKLPGYSGFTPGSRSEYGKTYGAMHRAIDKDIDGGATAISTGKGGASPGTSVGTTADRAVWSDRSSRTPRVVSAGERQLPGYTGYTPKHPHARGQELPAEAAKDEPPPPIKVPISENFHRQVRPNHQFSVRLSKSSVTIGADV